MRKTIVLAALAAGAAIALLATPSSATPRVASPLDANSLVTRVADVDSAAAPRKRLHRHARVHHGGSAAYWHYRLEGARWLHYQYANAGYPAYRYEGEVYYTYFPGDVCCGYSRHWPWMGHYYHGHRYWPWLGYRRHHHDW